MSLNYLYPEFEVLRHPRCTKCRLCEKECSNKVHHYDATLKVMVADDELRLDLPRQGTQDCAHQLHLPRR